MKKKTLIEKLDQMKPIKKDEMFNIVGGRYIKTHDYTYNPETGSTDNHTYDYYDV